MLVYFIAAFESYIIKVKNFILGKCAGGGGGGGSGALGMPNVVGVFIVTLGGCLVGA